MPPAAPTLFDFLPYLRPTAFLVFPTPSALAAGAKSPAPQPLPINESGILLHVKPTVRITPSGTADQYRDVESQVKLRLRVGTDELFNDQQSGKSVPVRTFLEMPEGFAFPRRIEAGDTLAAEWENNSTVSVIPELILGWIPDRMLLQMQQIDAAGRFL